MSRKRPKNKRPEAAVPEEILAEGSGPTTDAEALAQAASQAFAGESAGEDVLIEPAPEATSPAAKRTRGTRREVDRDAEVVFEAPAADDAPVGDDVAGPADEVEAAPEARKRKRGKRRDGDGLRGVVTTDAAPADPDAAIASGLDDDAELLASELDADADDDDDEAVEDDALRAQSADDADELASALDAESADDAHADDDSTATADEQALEAATMRAQAEAELGTAEPEAEPGDEDIELSASLPTTAASMDDTRLKHLVEALIFAADKPVNLQRLRQLTRVGDVKRLEAALDQIALDFADRGIALQVVSGGYQFRTNTGFSQWVQQLIAGRPVRLSRAQLETLAIIAYRQPITRPEIDDIRGVDSAATLRLLMDRSLIRILGKKEDVGRPILYGTTKEFLDFFSLNDLRELPTLREYSELTAESRKVMSERLGISVDASGADAVLESPPSDALVDDPRLADALDDDDDDDDDGEALVGELDAMSEDLETSAGDSDVRASVMTDAELDRAALEAVAAVDASATLELPEDVAVAQPAAIANEGTADVHARTDAGAEVSMGGGEQLAKDNAEEPSEEGLARPTPNSTGEDYVTTAEALDSADEPPAE